MTTFTSNGFTITRQPEINTQIEDLQRTGIERNFNYQNNKLIYQINNIFASKVAEVNEFIQSGFSTLYLSKAEGVWLDELSFLRGVPRLQAASSFTNSQFALIKPGTTIPQGTLFGSDIVPFRAFNPESVEADTAKSFETELQFSSAIANQPEGIVYSIVVDNATYSYTSVEDDTFLEVMIGIITQINGDAGRTWTAFTSTNPDGGAMVIIPAEGNTVSVTSLNSLITFNYTKVFFRLDLVETGPNDVPPNTITKLVSPILGVEGTNNNESFIIGRDKESDANLRLRIAAGPTSAASGTVLAIENKILTNVQNVSLTRVFENIDDYPLDADGRRFGEIEVLVVGGDDQEVARELFRNKGAGTPTTSTIPGATPIQILDDKGNQRSVYISRPTPIQIAFRISYALGEGDLPDGAELAMEAAVISRAGLQQLGQDVVPNQYIGNIYQAVPSGLGNVTVEVQVVANSGDAPNPAAWQVAPIAISEAQFAQTDGLDIEVVQL